MSALAQRSFFAGTEVGSAKASARMRKFFVRVSYLISPTGVAEPATDCDRRNYNSNDAVFPGRT